MNLEAYLSAGIETAASLARKLDISPALISQWRTGVRPIPVKRCSAIELATKGAIHRRDLRPDDWMDIWPELAANDGSAADRRITADRRKDTK
ncbi:MAG: Cro/CI family transcriptional regulator [Betaproteobacteria bacterium]|nr:Cro/CI family transcriptional regulator [Betaproteobacteria bacterium]